MDILPNVSFTIKLDSPDAVADKEWKHFKWSVVLEKNGKTFETEFKTGVGLIDKEKPRFMHMKNSMASVSINSTRDGISADRIPVSNLFELNKKHGGKWDYLLYQPKVPTKNEVLQSLAMEASSLVSMPTFEEWCSDFGYNSDSIKDKKMFDYSYEQTAKVKSLLGSDDFNLLLETDFDNLPDEASVTSDVPGVE